MTYPDTLSDTAFDGFVSATFPYDRSRGFYRSPFYEGGSREDREAMRALVLVYVPHTFGQSAGVSRGLCRICGFPFADATCAVGMDFPEGIAA